MAPGIFLLTRDGGEENGSFDSKGCWLLMYLRVQLFPVSWKHSCSVGLIPAVNRASTSLQESRWIHIGGWFFPENLQKTTVTWNFGSLNNDFFITIIITDALQKLNPAPDSQLPHIQMVIHAPFALSQTLLNSSTAQSEIFKTGMWLGALPKSYDAAIFYLFIYLFILLTCDKGAS